MQETGSADKPRVVLFGSPILQAEVPVPFAPERRFQLLALLAYHAGEWVERDFLAALFWPERSNSEARRNLRKVLFRANELAGIEALDAHDHVIRWTVATDLQQLRRALEEQRRADALTLLDRPLMAGIDDPRNRALTDWLGVERSRLTMLRQQVAVEHLGSLDGDAAAHFARQMLEVDPLEEAAVAALLRYELQRGQTQRAQRFYRDYAARLAEELGVEPSQGLRALFGGPPYGTADGDSTPSAATDAFVGRRSEMADAAAMLARPECRLLSVVGPGGVGKSRFARELLQQQRSRCPDCHWVQLQDVPDAAAATARIAQSLAIRINDTGDTLAQVVAEVASRYLLLVLDNCEHLALRDLLDRLLDAPRLTIVVTSRERLHCAAEWLLPLGGLAIPDEESRDLDAAAAFDAVRLFDVRARAADRRFALSRHLDAVVQIVEAVGGLPLAIELAASWVRLLPPEEIASDLHSSIDILAHDPAMAHELSRPEHASVRAALQRSWDLLGPFERQALVDASIFQGGFTRAAAHAVAQIAWPVLASLADKSLLALEPGGRFALHPMVARFASERLAAEPERSATLALRHAEHYARAAEDLAIHLRTDQRRLIDAVALDYANILAAWRTAIEHARTDLVRAMVRVLQTFFELRGRLAEGIAALRPALLLDARDEAAARAIVRVRHSLSMLYFRSGDLEQSQSLAEAAIAPAQACGDRSALGGCLLNIGSCQLSRGMARAALETTERALAIAREDHDRHAEAVALGNAGIAEKRLGNPERALELYRAALAAAKDLGDHYAEAIHLNNLGALMRSQDTAQALDYLRRGVAHCTAHGIGQMLPFFELNLGLTELDRGNVERAARHLVAALERSAAAGQRQIELSAELALTDIDLRQQRHESARQRLKRVASSSRAHSFIALLTDAAYFAGVLEAERGAVQRAAAIFIMCASHPAAEAASRQRATRRLLGFALSAEAHRAAAEQAPTLEAVIEELLGSQAAAGAT